MQNKVLFVAGHILGPTFCAHFFKFTRGIFALLRNFPVSCWRGALLGQFAQLLKSRSFSKSMIDEGSLFDRFERLVRGLWAAS